MINIAVCDDNIIQLDILKDMIDDTLNSKGIEHSIMCFSEADELIAHLNKNANKNETDIVFLDIKLKNETGIEIAKRINLGNQNIRIIFMTAHIMYARDIFEAAPTYFLVKPIEPNKLEAALASAIDAVSKARSAVISINQKGQLINLHIINIDYVSSSGRVVTIFENGRGVDTYDKMDNIEKKLGPLFVRCHQSYIVNMERIRSFDKLNIVLYSGVSIPVSKNRHTHAKNTFMKYLGGSL